MSLFQPVLSDIGDTQNIAQNLSTFSGHLARLKAFISQDLDLTNGLVLIDEICAGTDPTEGAALAKAVLKTLHDKGAVTVVTTHLGVLKTEAHEQPGYINASVEFDAEKLRPTYRLLVGIPGASNAITIAHRLGLPEAIINQARANLTQRTRESSELLQELEQKIRQAEEDRQLAASYKKSAEDTYKRVEANRHEQEFNKRHILQQFRQSLKDRVFQLEAELKHLKKKFKQEEFSEDTDLRLKRLSHAADKVMDTTDSEIEAEAIPLEAREITVGDVVSSKRWNVTGEVLSINKDKITIQAAKMTVTAGRTDLTKVGTEKYIQQKKQPKKASVGSIPMPNKSPELECHLLGLKRVDALDKMQEYLDQVSLAGYGKVGIIHGQGGGVLKKAVREYLKEADFVKKFYPADAVDGGDGKTIVEL